jgi:putative endopeptidase
MTLMKTFFPAPMLLILSLIATAPQGSAQQVSGIDQALFSDNISPGENFYLHCNQKWLDTTPLPSDKSNYGVFTLLEDRTSEQVKQLIEQASATKSEPGSAAQKVGDLYNSVLNTEARDQAGTEPIRPMLDKIDSIGSQTELAEAMGQLSQIGVSGPFGAYVSVDARDSDSYALHITETGLTMPDRDYYLEAEPRYEEARRELVNYIVDLFSMASIQVGPSDAQGIVELETKLAKIQWTKTENRDPIKTYNKKSLDELESMLGTIDLDGYLAGANIDAAKDVIVNQPSYLEQLAKLSETVPLDTWKRYLQFKLINGYADSLSSSLEKRHFEFHGQVISGITEQEPLWKRAADTTGSVLGELVGQLYVEKHFQPEAKKRMDELVENLKRAFAKRIESREWMGEGTKKQALEKLSLFTTKIGYPDPWKDYTDLKIDSPRFADNLMASAKFEHARELKKLGGPIDRSEWHMTPHTINAYYNPTMNEIVFPAAILQPPFFNLLADDAVNYGAIGAVIGHELSHGFDDKGSEYDGKGNLRKWWTQEDRQEFDRRAKVLSGQYSRFEPVKGNFVNGELTLGENIGDLGGLNVAHEAYRLACAGKEPPVIDEMTGDQRFFLGWGQIWRRLYREPELLKRLVTDPHSPSEYRVNGIVRNMDAWYKAFDIQPSSKMYLPPEQRVRIW